MMLHQRFTREMKKNPLNKSAQLHIQEYFSWVDGSRCQLQLQLPVGAAICGRAIKTPNFSLTSLFQLLKPHYVLIKIKSMSLNYQDLDVMSGYYNSFRKHGSTPLPLASCSDGAGVFVSVGEEVDEEKIKVGDEVLCLYNTEHMSGSVTMHHMATGSGCL
jgi:hypothetical protein